MEEEKNYIQEWLYDISIRSLSEEEKKLVFSLCDKFSAYNFTNKEIIKILYLLPSEYAEYIIEIYQHDYNFEKDDKVDITQTLANIYATDFVNLVDNNKVTAQFKKVKEGNRPLTKHELIAISPCFDMKYSDGLKKDFVPKNKYQKAIYENLQPLYKDVKTINAEYKRIKDIMLDRLNICLNDADKIIEERKEI